jgi:hypothetical protein
MRNFLLTGTAAFVAVAGMAPEQASAVTLTDGVEVIESFSAQTPTYQFDIDFTAGTPLYLDMAFGAAPGQQYDLQFLPPANGSLGDVPSSLSYTGPQSVSLELEPTMNAGYMQGVLQMDVTLTNIASDPLGGFEISNSPITLDIPAATPIPAALPLFATGLGGLGLFGWRRKRKAQAAA